MSRVDDEWCDWCGDEIPAQTRRSQDDRVFCGHECLAEYRQRGDLAHAVVELPAEKLAQLQVEGPRE
ncbi:hypothetical protein [Nocardia miyunensis]|uniref:hypothetical protein n=1 Tax=Nocardia miyunensis TaxID=282684 RepID=UPI00082FAEBE|nr:hypothetical protein [Nocardia miyunensis]